MPKLPDNANENSVTGFHATVAYYAAAMDYLVKTGSLDAVKKVKLAGNDAQENEALAKSIAQGIEQKTWYVDPSAWYELKESQPAIMSDGNLLFKSVYTFDYGAESVANGEIKPVKEEERVSTQDCDFRGRYNPTTKSWELHRQRVEPRTLRQPENRQLIPRNSSCRYPCPASEALVMQEPGGWVF